MSDPLTTIEPSEEQRPPAFEFPQGDYRGVAFDRFDRIYDLVVLHVPTKRVMWRGQCEGYQVWTWAAHLSDLIDEFPRIPEEPVSAVKDEGDSFLRYWVNRAFLQQWEDEHERPHDAMTLSLESVAMREAGKAYRAGYEAAKKAGR